jgi:anti-anti-sigma regulatory factor
VRQEDGRLEAVVVDADSVTLTDTDGADILIQVAQELEAQGTSLVLARVRPEVVALWRRFGLGDGNGSGQAYPTVPEAVDAVSKGGTTMEDGSR